MRTEQSHGWTKIRYTCQYHWRWALFLALLPVGGSILLARLAGATTVLEKTFPALVQEAEVIAVGTVTAIETEWNTKKEAPFTFVTFSNLDIVKGDLGQAELTLRFLGGPTPDGLVMQIAGTPQFSLGERSVIFCVGNQHQAVPLVGMWQGVYRVVFDPARKIETIANHAGQPVTALPMGQTQGGVVHDEPLSHHAQKETGDAALPLETFLQLIEQEVQSGQ